MSREIDFKVQWVEQRENEDGKAEEVLKEKVYTNLRLTGKSLRNSERYHDFNALKYLDDALFGISPEDLDEDGNLKEGVELDADKGMDFFYTTLWISTLGDNPENDEEDFVDSIPFYKLDEVFETVNKLITRDMASDEQLRKMSELNESKGGKKK